nr:hypothetical protein [Tanacetum cinerariifolium]
MSWYSRCLWCGGPFNGGNCQRCTNVSFGNEPVYDSNSNSYNQTTDFSYPPSQLQTSSFDQFYCYGCGDLVDRCQQCICKSYGSGLIKGIYFICASSTENSFTYDPNPNSFDDSQNLSDYPPQPQRFNSICYDDDDDYDYEESTIPLSDIISQTPPSIVITTYPLILLIKDLEVSLIMRNEELNTIPERESNEFIKSSVEDLVPIPNDFEDTFGSDSNDDESLFDEDVLKDNVRIYSNPLFEFDDEYISSDVNPFFNEVLEEIECKDSYDSNLDESTFLVTPLIDSNEDEYFATGDDVELLLHRDPSTPSMSVVSILEGFIDEPPLKENDDLLDLKSKNDKWKKILYDAPIDDLMSEDKIFDPGIPDQNFSPTYVRLPFEDHHYLFFTYFV